MNSFRKPVVFIFISILSLCAAFFLLPLSYTYVGSHYLGGAQIFIPSLQLITWENTQFQENLWKEHARTPEGKRIRGSMVKELLQSRNFSQMSKEEIYTLLGNDTGYFHEDHIIAYSIIHNDTAYTLAFPGHIPTLEVLSMSQR